MKGIKQGIRHTRSRHGRRPQPGAATGAGSLAVYLLVLMLLVDGLMLMLYFITLDYPDDSVTRLFHVDIEKNFPSTWSALKLLLAGFAVFACIPVDDGRGRGRVTYRDVWLIMGTLLILMSIDEYFAFHERFDWIFYRLRIITDEVPLGGYAWPWTIIGGVLALAAGAFLAHYIYRIFAGRRWLFYLLVLAGLLFVSGAIGLENYGVYLDNFHGSEGANLVMGVEEFMEMAAISLVLFVFLRYRGERVAEEE